MEIYVKINISFGMKYYPTTFYLIYLPYIDTDPLQFFMIVLAMFVHSVPIQEKDVYFYDPDLVYNKYHLVIEKYRTK